MIKVGSHRKTDCDATSLQLILANITRVSDVSVRLQQNPNKVDYIEAITKLIQATSLMIMLKKAGFDYLSEREFH